MFMIMSCFWKAYCIFKYRQLPFPNDYVLKRTRITRGTIVIIDGVFMILLGLAIISVAVYFWFEFNVPIFFDPIAYKVTCA